MSLTFRCLLALLLCTICSCEERVESTEKSQSLTEQEASLKKIVEEYPDSLPLQDNLANFYQENEDFDKALAVMLSRAKKDSQNDKLQEAIGFLYYEIDDTAKAIIHYKNAFNLVADKSYLIAMATLEAGRKNPIALQLADEIIRIDKTNSTEKAFYIKGVFYSRNGDLQLAMDNFDRAIKAGYTFTPPYLEKAQLLMRSKNYEEAIVTLDKGIAVQNNFPEAYYYKGVSLYELGHKKASLEAFDLALLYDPNYTDAINDKQKYFGK